MYILSGMKLRANKIYNNLLAHITVHSEKYFSVYGKQEPFRTN